MELPFNMLVSTDPAKVSAWRLLWSTVPPKMALSTSAVKALVFPYYHGSQIIEDEVTEKEVSLNSFITDLKFCVLINLKKRISIEKTIGKRKFTSQTARVF